MGVAKLRGQVADYDWGGVGALSELLDWGESSSLEAEWWLGTHPLRPSTIESGELLSKWLGREEGREDLPYLFKVLSPRTPLSLQVHPNLEQARAGFDREQEAGLALHEPRRMYKDVSAKPELVVALARPFEALAGLRPAEQTIAALDSMVSGDYPKPLASWREKLSSKPLTDVVSWLLTDREHTTQILFALEPHASKDDTLSRLFHHYPGDPGIAVGFMLNRLSLSPGQAAFLDAGQLHAYLEGFAIELMAPSDNVLRGGLTTKHVDVPALLTVASGEPIAPPIVQPTISAEGVRTFSPNGAGFTLAHAEGDLLVSEQALSGPLLLVCTDGQWVVEGASESVTLGKGEAAIASSGERSVTLRGSGQLWWAQAS